jgi:hypothetical protein
MNRRSLLRALGITGAGLAGAGLVGPVPATLDMPARPERITAKRGPYILRLQHDSERYGHYDMTMGDEYQVNPGAEHLVTLRGLPVPEHHLSPLMGFVINRSAEVIPATAKWTVVAEIDRVIVAAIRKQREEWEAWARTPEGRKILARIRRDYERMKRSGPRTRAARQDGAHRQGRRRSPRSSSAA